MSDDPHTALEQRSRELFEDSVARLDGATRSRLTQARHAALNAAQTKATTPMRWLMPVGSAAALTLATVVTVHLINDGVDDSLTPSTATMASTSGAAVVDDLEIVTADADLDMLKDMDFYLWLDAEELHGPKEDG